MRNSCLKIMIPSGRRCKRKKQNREFEKSDPQITQITAGLETRTGLGRQEVWIIGR